ncbi:hypothetical protein LOZ11_005666 [Ophidiomyces ophidiicola]|nr:hypothetical protein LOZ11_005666 [Ophidiomyces ophidiicola]
MARHRYRKTRVRGKKKHHRLSGVKKFMPVSCLEVLLHLHPTSSTSRNDKEGSEIPILGGGNVARCLDGGTGGVFHQRSHMNPNAAPFIPSNERQQVAPVPEDQPSLMQLTPFPSRLPPPSYTPLSTYQPAHPSFGSESFFGPLEASCNFDIPAYYFFAQESAFTPFRCECTFCCYAQMAPPTADARNCQSWAPPAPNHGYHGPATFNRLPTQMQPQGPVVSQQQLNSSSANPTARGYQTQFISTHAVHQNPCVQGNFQPAALQNDASAAPREYKGPLIVPPKSVPSIAGANTHQALHHTEPYERAPRLQVAHHQTVTAPSAYTSAPNTFSGTDPRLASVNNISVTSSTINLNGKVIDIPIDDGARQSSIPTAGVLKIMNRREADTSLKIPYGISKQEVLHLMGRRARLLPSCIGTPVHIIMDRSTAKTMDCYVEFLTSADAKETLEWFNRGLPSSPPHLGDRVVDVEISSQDELLKDLFPRANCILWKNGRPILTPNNDPYSVGFKGFLTTEEIYCMIRNAEMPRRAPFASKCPQRTYESLASTLYKFPWHATALYTVEDRNALYYACYRQLEALVPRVAEKQTLGLDSRLVLDLLAAGLRCPTFSDRQKAALYAAAGDMNAFNATPATAKYWPFDTLICKSNANEETVNKFARLVAAGVGQKNPGNKVLANNWVPRQGVSSPFGCIWLEFGRGHAHLKWDMAIQYETKVLREVVFEGLKATREGPQRGSSTPRAAGNNGMARRP